MAKKKKRNFHSQNRFIGFKEQLNLPLYSEKVIRFRAPRVKYSKYLHIKKLIKILKQKHKKSK